MLLCIHAFIHSFFNSLISSLPPHLTKGSENNDLKRFLNMIGEQYDLIRNHIDNYSTIYTTNSKKIKHLTQTSIIIPPKQFISS